MTQPPRWTPQHTGDGWDRYDRQADQPTIAFPTANSHSATPPPPPPAAPQPQYTYPAPPVAYAPIPPQRNSNAAVWVVVGLLTVALLGVAGYLWLWPLVVNDAGSQSRTSTVVVTTHAAVPSASGPVPAQGNSTVPANSTPCARVFTSASLGTSAVGSSVTSCEFAEEVRAAYLRQPVRGATVAVNAHSPVTSRSYVMTCSGSTVVTCTGGNDAIVYVY